MKRLISVAGFVGGVICGALSLVNPASADLLFTLGQSNCCGSGPFATVLLDDISDGVVDVTVTLITPPATGFTNTGLTSFVFNNSVALTETDVSGLSSGFTWADPTKIKGDGAGDFQFGFDCTGCGNGGSDPLPGPLEFTLTHAGLSSGTFTANAIQPAKNGDPQKGGNFFGVDICFNTSADAEGCSATGMVWTSRLPPECTGACGDNSVPEPAPLALIAASAIALAVSRRRPLLRR